MAYEIIDYLNLSANADIYKLTSLCVFNHCCTVVKLKLSEKTIQC